MKEDSSTMYQNSDVKWNEFVTPHRKTLDMENYTMHYIDIGQVEPRARTNALRVMAQPRH
jgi:hypothetical protein